MCKFCSKISFAKSILIIIIFFSVGTVLGVTGYLFIAKPKLTQPQPALQTINKIEISSDGKSILAEKLYTEVKVPIFTIDDAKKYLKDSGYEYNPDTFQDTNAKYLGDCFSDAALSNNKKRIVFSAICLPGDLPQPWIGIHNLPIDCKKCDKPMPDPVVFLTGGSGRNFVWSQDDKTITYEADLGLSGMTETRTIDSTTGKILEKKNSPATNNTEAKNTSSEDLVTKDWETYKNEEYGFEISYPAGWDNMREVDYQGNKYLTLDNDDNKEFANIRKFKVEKGQSFKNILVNNTNIGESGNSHPEFSDFKLLKIGDNNFYYFNNHLFEGRFSVTYWYVKESILIQFELSANSTEDWTDDSWQLENQLAYKRFNQILSTFKFVESNNN